MTEDDESDDTSYIDGIGLWTVIKDILSLQQHNIPDWESIITKLQANTIKNKKNHLAMVNKLKGINIIIQHHTIKKINKEIKHIKNKTEQTIKDIDPIIKLPRDIFSGIMRSVREDIVKSYNMIKESY